MRYLSLFILLPLLAGMLLLPTSPPAVRADVGIPGPDAQTIYSVTNPQAAPLMVLHLHSDGSGFEFSFFDEVPAGATVEYHVRDMPQISSPYSGTVQLSASAAFSATIAGYDYPATATPTATRTVTATPTGGTATVTPTATALPTYTPTATPRFEIWLPVVK